MEYFHRIKQEKFTGIQFNGDNFSEIENFVEYYLYGSEVINKDETESKNVEIYDEYGDLISELLPGYWIIFGDCGENFEIRTDEELNNEFVKI